jgi:hypothetical protein
MKLEIPNGVLFPITDSTAAVHDTASDLLDKISKRCERIIENGEIAYKNNPAMDDSQIKMIHGRTEIADEILNFIKAHKSHIGTLS